MSRRLLLSLLNVVLAASGYAQEPIDSARLASMLDDRAVFPDTMILRIASESCLNFVPRPERTRAFRARRRFMVRDFEQRLAGLCVRGLPAEVSIEDVVFLVRRGTEGVVLDEVASCPGGATPYVSVSRAARSGASRRTLRHLAALCNVSASPRRLEFAFELGYLPLAVAPEIRQEGVDFLGGFQFGAAVTYAVHEALKVAAQAEFAGYRLDPPGVDSRASGNFRMTAGGLSVRFLPTCLMRSHRCGDYLFSSDDVYVEVGGLLGSLSGNLDVPTGPAPSDPTVPVHYTFTGPAFTLGAGYTRRLTRWLAVEGELTRQWVRFGSVEWRTDRETLSDDVGGTTARTGVSVSLILGLSVR